MKPVSQILLGVISALVSSLVLVGSLWLALAENGQRIALAPTQAPASPTQPAATQLPGQPTFTPLPPTERPTATLPPPPTNCPPPSGWQAITVGPDDTLDGLAQAYQTTPQELSQANCLVISGLPAGSLLYVPPIPPTATPTFTAVPPSPTQPEPTRSRPTKEDCGAPAGWVVYIVRPNDTLSGLAQALGVTVQQIRRANCLGGSNVIRSGQELWLPALPPAPPPIRPPTEQPEDEEPPNRVSPVPSITEAPDTAVPTEPPPTAGPPTEAPPTVAPTEPPPPTEEPPLPTIAPPPIPTFPPPPETQEEPTPFPTFPPPAVAEE